MAEKHLSFLFSSANLEIVELQQGKRTLTQCPKLKLLALAVQAAEDAFELESIIETVWANESESGVVRGTVFYEYFDSQSGTTAKITVDSSVVNICLKNAHLDSNKEQQEILIALCEMPAVLECLARIDKAYPDLLFPKKPYSLSPKKL